MHIYIYVYICIRDPGSLAPKHPRRNQRVCLWSVIHMYIYTYIYIYLSLSLSISIYIHISAILGVLLPKTRA